MLSPSNIDEGSYDGADHFVEEGVADHVDDDEVLSPKGTSSTRDAHSVEVPDARAVVVGLCGEGAEIVLPFQVLRGLGHRRHVESLGNVPGRGLEGGAGWAVEDAVAVVLAAGGVTRVKVAGHVPHAADRDVVGEDRVEAGEQTPRGESRGGLEAGDLSQGVHARVGPAGGDDPDVLPGDLGDSSLDFPHRGARVGLDLPACEVPARVFDQQLNVALFRRLGAAVVIDQHGLSLAGGRWPDNMGCLGQGTGRLGGTNDL